MEIDKNTGLPQLPENFFWSVGPWEIRIKENVGPGEWSDWYSQLSWPIDKTSYEIETKNERYSFWRNTKFIRFRRKPTTRTVFIATYNEDEYDVDEDFLESPDKEPVTAENLVARCTEIYGVWRKFQEANSIYGDYPPKSFGV